jgi:SAM-dependent methyltransferase
MSGYDAIGGAFEALRRPVAWGRGEDPDKIALEYVAERSLARRLKAAGPHERGPLYAAAYNEVIRRSYVDFGARQDSLKDRGRRSLATARALHRFLKPHMHLVEIGPGDGRVSLAAAAWVRQVTMLDVRTELARCVDLPRNVRLVVTDGLGAPLEPCSADLVFCDQLVEHLHPDDVSAIHRNVFDALKPGGAYICLSPNRLLGPHDLTRYFGGSEPEGLHLREYSLGDLVGALNRVGFGRVRPLVGGGPLWIPVPLDPILAIERRWEALTVERRSALRWKPGMRQALAAMLGARVIAEK